MKTKSLSIALFMGIFMLAFVSCSKDAKIRRIEKRVVRLEENYRDMTQSEFDEDYHYCMDELEKISEGELTKNQKKEINSLKWRLRKVWVEVHFPIGEIPIESEGEGQLAQYATALLLKPTLGEIGDTLTLDVYFTEVEKYISTLQDIHIESAADTLQIVEFENKLAQKNINADVFDSEINLDPDQLKHSEKVRVMRDMISFMSELLRLDQELKAVGINSSKWNLGEDEERFKETLNEFKNALELELE